MPIRTALPPKLEAVMVRLCTAARLNKTQAVKLPYLVDVVAKHVLGRRITEGNHEAWQYGVVSSEAWRYLDSCEETPALFELDTVPFSEEKRVRVVRETESLALSPEELKVVDYVAEEFAHIPAVALGQITKLMNPSVTSWGGNSRADIGEDAYERMSDEYQDMANDVVGVTLEQLRRDSRPANSVEEALA